MKRRHFLRPAVWLCILLGLSWNSVSADASPRATQGVLDLQGLDWEEAKTVALKGEWAFFWKELRDPNSTLALPGEAPTFESIPGSWNGAQIDAETLGSKGFATYALKVILPPSDEILALKIPPIRSAFSLWANGKEVAHAGKVATGPTEYLPSYSPGVFLLPPGAKTLDLVLHTSNFHHRSGGMGFAMTIGPHDDVHRLHRIKNLYEIFLFASLFVIALYHFGIYILRWRELSPLYFSLMCFAGFVRVPLEGQYLFYQFFPDANWIFWLKVDYLTFIFVIMMFKLFLWELFPREWNKYIFKGLVGTGLLFALAFVVLPLSFAGYLVPMAQVFVLLSGLYCLFVVILAVRKKRDGATIMLVALGISILFYINDILYYYDQLGTGVLTTSGSFFLIIVQAFLLSNRYSRAFSLTEIYAKTFQKFVPIQFLNRIAKDGISSIALGNAETEDAVILFSDIRGFTALSEQLSPDEVFDFLNDYLSRMEPPVRQNDGFVDKYLGDAIMALFTADKPEDGARNALKAAIEMKKALEKFNHDRESIGKSQVLSGIGLHFGEVIIGTVGGGERMDSTAIGDSVNVASRVEGLTKLYQTSILATDDVLNALADRSEFQLRFIDRVRVVGKSVPTELWEVLGFSNKNPEANALRQGILFEKATEHYFKQEFELSLQAFEAYLKLVPDDHTAWIYVARCKEMMVLGAPKGWDGVTDMTQK